MTRPALTLAVLALALAAPATASADLAKVSGDTLSFAADRGEVDTLEIAAVGSDLRVTESTSANGSPGAGCRGGGAGSGYVLCAAAGVTKLTVATLDGDDVVRVAVALPAAVDAGTGADTVTTGAGPDVVDARDGERDVIDCGAGADVLLADAVDAATGCETRSGPAPAGEPLTSPVLDEPLVPVVPVVPVVVPVAPVVPVVAATVPPVPADAPADAPAPAAPVPPVTVGAAVVAQVAVLERAVAVSAAGTASVELRCDEAAGCRGVVLLDPVPARRAAKPRRGPKRGGGATARAARRGRFGRSPFTAAAGARTSVPVRLSAEARRRLGLRGRRGARAARRGRRVQAQVTIQVAGRRPVRTVVALRR